MKTKPDCYKCRYRGDLSGNAHSCCRYPGNKTGMLDYFAPENNLNAVKLNIQGAPHGIRMGWFNWPVDFDPTWLRNCDGFELKQ